MSAFLDSLCEEYRQNNHFDPDAFQTWEVKRGLRNADGTGVMAGITNIGNVRGYYVQDGERVPMPGQLIYRGVDVTELIGGFTSEGRFGFEETAYLLLFGALPTQKQLSGFLALMEEFRELPAMFTEDMILKAPSPDVMNKLGRAVLTLYSYDDNPEDMSLSAELSRAIGLIARAPTIVAQAFSAKRHYYDNESLYLHRAQPGLSLAENFLWSVRHDNKFTPEEARLLDVCLVVHAEHGGGNNSAFACRVLSSTGTDIYAAISAAIGSLKGPRHGGANKKVMEQFAALEAEVGDWADEEEVSRYLGRVLDRDAGDGSGLIYGMGHAIYTVSDPRAVMLKKFARDLAESKGMLAEFDLYETVERLSPQVMAAHGNRKVVCANVDMFSGFVYKMMGIPMELYTPLFAVARMAGWCAHRVEEIFTPGNRIMRPAYKAVAPQRPFVPMAER